MQNRSLTLAFAFFLLLAGCSDGKESVEKSTENEDAVAMSEAAPAKTAAMRKEFVIVREIVRQHDLQTYNEKRMKVIVTALKAKFPLLPDKGETEEEKRIYHEAETLFQRL